MKKFYLFKAHDYMDMHPHDVVECFDNEQQAQEYAAWMRENYSGGTTSFDHEMSKEEVANWFCKELKACLMDTCWPDEDNLRSALAVTSENNLKLFFECYGRDHKKLAYTEELPEVSDEEVIKFLNSYTSMPEDGPLHYHAYLLAHEYDLEEDDLTLWDVAHSYLLYEKTGKIIY